MNKAIVTGSLSAMAEQTNKSIAETFISADAVVIVDTSGSMSAHDSRGNQERYAVACEELANLQQSLPGKVAVISFSSTVQFDPGGRPTYLGGGTDMVGALKFAKVADLPGMKFFLISDGQPDDERRTIDVARTYTNRINTIFVGPESDSLSRNFLRKLADATGGEHVTIGTQLELEAGIVGLLEGG